jgi:hypothetical protein
MKMKGIKAALTRKFGPLPAWAWLAIAGGAYYLWRRRQGATTGGSGSTQGDPGSAGVGDTPAGTPGGSGDSGGGGGSQDQPPVPAGGFGGGGGDHLQPNGTGSSPASNPDASAAAKAKRAADLKVAQARVSASNPDFAAAERAKTAAGKAAGVPVAFGGVKDTRTLKNGATLTTFNSGRQVEQVKGKSAYVTNASAKPKRKLPTPKRKAKAKPHKGRS